MEIIIMIIVIIALRVSKVHMSINDAGSRMRSYDPFYKTFYDSRGYMYMEGHWGKVYRTRHPKTNHDIITDKHGIIRDITQERLNNDEKFKAQFDNGEYTFPNTPIVYHKEHEWYDLQRAGSEHAYYSRHWWDGHIVYDPITDRPCIRIGCPHGNSQYLEFHPEFFNTSVLIDAETGRMLRIFDENWDAEFALRFVDEYNKQQEVILQKNKECHGYYDLGLFFLVEGTRRMTEQLNYATDIIDTYGDKKHLYSSRYWYVPLTEEFLYSKKRRPNQVQEREWDYE